MATKKKNPNPFGVYAGPSDAEIAERNARLEAEGRLATPGVEVTRDAADKKMFDARMDLDPMLGGDPLKEAWDRYGTPGMQPKFLGERCMTVLGRRGYEIVKDENGDPVKVGTLVMGQIPERVAEARRLHFANESLRNVADIEAQYTDNVNRLKRDANDMGLQVLGRGEMQNPAATDDILASIDG